MYTKVLFFTALADHTSEKTQHLCPCPKWQDSSSYNRECQSSEVYQRYHTCTGIYRTCTTSTESESFMFLDVNMGLPFTLLWAHACIYDTDKLITVSQ